MNNKAMKLFFSCNDDELNSLKIAVGKQLKEKIVNSRPLIDQTFNIVDKNFAHRDACFQAVAVDNVGHERMLTGAHVGEAQMAEWRTRLKQAKSKICSDHHRKWQKEQKKAEAQKKPAECVDHVHHDNIERERECSQIPSSTSSNTVDKTLKRPFQAEAPLEADRKEEDEDEGDDNDNNEENDENGDKDENEQEEAEHNAEEEDEDFPIRHHQVKRLRPTISPESTLGFLATSKTIGTVTSNIHQLGTAAEEKKQKEKQENDDGPAVSYNVKQYTQTQISALEQESARMLGEAMMSLHRRVTHDVQKKLEEMKEQNRREVDDLRADLLKRLDNRGGMVVAAAADCGVEHQEILHQDEGQGHQE